MSKSFGIATVAMAALAATPGLAGAQWTTLVSEAAIGTAVTAASQTTKADYDVAIVAVSPNGRFIVFNDTDTTHYLYCYDRNTSTLSFLTKGADIATAVKALNPDMTFSDMRIQAIDITASNQVVMYVVETGTFNFESLVGIPATGGPITVYVTDTTANATNDTPLNGIGGVACVGNTVYMTRVANFAGGGTDDLWSVDTSVASPPGTYALTTVLSSITSVVAGDTGTETVLRASDIARRDATSVVISDSAAANCSDDFILVSGLGGTPAASLFVDAGDVQTDLGATDMGFSAHAFAPSGALFAQNKFGSGTGDDAIIRVDGPGGGLGTAPIFINETDLGTALSATIDLNAAPNRSMTFDVPNNCLLQGLNADGQFEGIAQYSFITASVEAWELY